MPRPPPYKMMQISPPDPSDGEERVLAVHRAGGLMGEASFFDGCPRVTVSRVLGELSALGLTALAYRSVTVLDRVGLEALAFPPDP